MNYRRYRKLIWIWTYKFGLFMVLDFKIWWCSLEKALFHWYYLHLQEGCHKKSWCHPFPCLSVHPHSWVFCVLQEYLHFHLQQKIRQFDVNLDSEEIWWSAQFFFRQNSIKFSLFVQLLLRTSWNSILAWGLLHYLKCSQGAYLNSYSWSILIAAPALVLVPFVTFLS